MPLFLFICFPPYYYYTKSFRFSEYISNKYNCIALKGMCFCYIKISIYLSNMNIYTNVAFTINMQVTNILI